MAVNGAKDNKTLSITILIAVVGFLAGVGLVHLTTASTVAVNSIKIDRLEKLNEGQTEMHTETLKLLNKLIDQNSILINR